MTAPGGACRSRWAGHTAPGKAEYWLYDGMGCEYTRFSALDRAQRGHVLNPRTQLSLFALFLIASTAHGESRPVHWTESAPPARVGACAVYDSVSDRVLLLGGAFGTDSPQRSRLPAWECGAGGTGLWRRSALPSFAGASPTSSALDPVRRQFWQFDGELPYGFAERLDVSSTAHWDLVPITFGPGFYSWEAMAFDVSHDRILGLTHSTSRGGQDSLALFSAPIADTLRFARVAITGAQPLGLISLTVAWDQARSEFVVLSAWTHTGAMTGIRILDTSEDPHWETLTPAPDPIAGSPTDLYTALAAADPTSSDLYMVEHALHPIGFVIERQLWKLEREPLLRWARLAPPPLTAIRGALAVDARRRTLALFGGSDARGTPLGRTQLFDIATDSWTVSEPLVVPEARASYAIAYDHPRDRVLMFGGMSTQSGSLLDDLWARTSVDGVWHRIEVTGASPPGRIDATLVEDPRRDRLLLIGGWQGAPAPIELWVLSHVDSPEWARLLATGDAPDRVDGAILDVARDRLVIHGAISQPFQVAEWELTLGATPHWRRLPVVSTSPPPQLNAFALDAARGMALVFGGVQIGVDQTISFDTVWGFPLDADSVRWVRLSEPNLRIDGEFSPYVNQGAIAIDPVRDRLVSFGGIGSTSLLEQRPSEIALALPLDGSQAWLDLDPVDGGPAPTAHKPIVYDPIRDAFILFGAGYHPSNTSTFELDGGYEGWPRVSFRVAGAMHSAVRLEWRGPDGPVEVPVMRRTAGGAWARVGMAVRGSDGVFRFTDTEVATGVSPHYRLAWPVAGGDIPVGELILTVGTPATAAVHVRGDPAHASVVLDLDLPAPGPVRVQLVDIAGRVVTDQRLESTSAGRLPFEIVPASSVRPGLYFVRVTSPAGIATARVTLLK